MTKKLQNLHFLKRWLVKAKITSFNEKFSLYFDTYDKNILNSVKTKTI